MTIHVICVAWNRAIPLRILIDSFLVQTDSRWILRILHDGKANEEVKQVIKLYSDCRILYEETSKVNGLWGHPNRKMMLGKLDGAYDDYVLISNDDNYYVPVFVEYFLRECKPGVGMVFCNTVHSYMQYAVLQTRVLENYIDMGSFIVRLDVAKSVGFNHMHEQADGKYAEECAAACRANGFLIKCISKPLFVHN